MRCPRQVCASARLSDAIDDGFVGNSVELPPSSWGSGKDWQVWSGSRVADLVRLNTEVVDVALSTVDKALAQHASVGAPTPRDGVADQILREALLTVSSDWPFMVSKDTAADYARYRAHLHAHATREIADALASGRRDHAERLADGLESRRRPVRRARREAAPAMTAPSPRARVSASDTPRPTRLCARSR